MQTVTKKRVCAGVYVRLFNVKRLLKRFIKNILDWKETKHSLRNKFYFNLKEARILHTFRQHLYLTLDDIRSEDIRQIIDINLFRERAIGCGIVSDVSSVGTHLRTNLFTAFTCFKQWSCIVFIRLMLLCVSSEMPSTDVWMSSSLVKYIRSNAEIM